MNKLTLPVLLSLVACATQSATVRHDPPPRRPPAEIAAALPFIENDYGRALAEAKQRKLPVFVDAWAPW